MPKNIYKDILSKIYNLKKNDIVNITSNILPLLINFNKSKKEFNPNKFIDAIKEKVGHKGTVLFPAFNWDFCKKKRFDYYKSLPETGALSNVVFKRKDFKRTRHPIYSFLVWGKDTEYLCNLNNKSGWGSNSPFSYFYKCGAKNLFIGLDYKKGFTFMHYPEEKIGTKYRFLKNFSGSYLDEKRNKKIVTYSMNARYLDKSDNCYVDPRLENALIDKKAFSKYLINDTDFTLINLRIAGNIMENEIQANRSFLIYRKGK